MFPVPQRVRQKQAKVEGEDIAPLYSTRGSDRKYLILLSDLTPLSSSPEPSFSSTHESISSPASVQSLSTSASFPLSTSVSQTPFTVTFIETFQYLSTSVPQESIVTMATHPRPWPWPSFTMCTITLAPIHSTSATKDAIPSVTQSGFYTNPTVIPSIPSAPFDIPAPIPFSPKPSCHIRPTTSSILYSSHSAISLSRTSADETINQMSTSVGSPISSVVETEVLSTDTPHDTSFAHQAGAVIGVALAGAFFLLLIVIIIFFVCKRHYSNRSYHSSMEDILAVSRTTSWRPPLEGDDEHSDSISPNDPNSLGSEGELFGAESTDANGTSNVFGGQPRVPPTGLTLYDLMDPRDQRIFHRYSSHDGDDIPWPCWRNTEPLSINQCNGSQRSPLDSHSDRSASSLGLGAGSSIVYHGSGSSGEALVTRGNTRRTSIPETRYIHRLTRQRHYSIPPTSTFALARDSNLEYDAQRIQQHHEQQKQPDRKDISQGILARLHTNRRPSTASTMKGYSQCTTTRSAESAPSSYVFSPSLLNPPISIPHTIPRIHHPYEVTGINGYTPDDELYQCLHYPQGIGDTSEGYLWPGSEVAPAPSPVPTDTSSMVEGLLHPRLGMALSQSQQASDFSLRDHEDYTRPINGLVDNCIRSTTTFEMQDTTNAGE